MIRGQLIQQICEIKGYAVEFIPNTEFQKAIQDLPTENLEKLLNDGQKRKEYSERIFRHVADAALCNES